MTDLRRSSEIADIAHNQQYGALQAFRINLASFILGKKLWRKLAEQLEFKE